MDTSIRVIGSVTLTNGKCRDVYELEDGTQLVVDDDGGIITGTWLVTDDPNEGNVPCDRPVIVYLDGESPF